MATHIPPSVAAGLRNQIDSYTNASPAEIAGLIYGIVNRDGDLVFSHASGRIGLGRAEAMTFDTTFWMASFTKMITGIACMQLVEQNLLALDDVELVEALAPELKEVKVLDRDGQGDIVLVPKRHGITLRMLLNHTAGFGYVFEDTTLRDWSRPVGLSDFTDKESDILLRPLSNQPGSKFQYGTNVDWAGMLVARASKMSLEEYFQKNIFKPLGIDGITLAPTVDMISHLAYMHQRDPDGSLLITDHLFRDPLLIQGRNDVKDRFYSGGAGCFGKPIQYCKIIAVLLNDGQCPKTKTRLLKPETVREMFTDQIPDKPRFCNEYVPTANPLLANPTPIFPAPDDLTEGWGLTFSLSHEAISTGRAAGSGSWEGLANLFWFADRQNGLGGIIASQILPYGDKTVLTLSEKLETKIYSALASLETAGI